MRVGSIEFAEDVPDARPLQIMRARESPDCRHGARSLFAVAPSQALPSQWSQQWPASFADGAITSHLADNPHRGSLRR